MPLLTKKEAVRRAHRRVRKKVHGTTDRPRLAVHKSEKNIYAQIIDDEKQITLIAASSLDGDFKKSDCKHGANCESARLVGKLIAERALKNSIRQVVFDRGGHIYHGRVKVLAEAAREAGLEF
ncbi:MAG: 50S ribosomal protein L18 [Candidatus Caenarcaniphilales bacterium]|nr:50S ribosomal protein L18 [Candidatus Caenarcaniphilales bacterium]